MNSNNVERQLATTPEHELAIIRGEVAKEHSNAETRGEKVSEHQIAGNVIENYANSDHREVLAPDLAIKDHEANEIVLELSPEAHDKQMEQLISLVAEKGIRNTINVVERMNNPHLYDDFHRFLVQFVTSGYELNGLDEKDPIWKPLHMTLFEVSLPEADAEELKGNIEKLISGMEQFYSGMLSINDDPKSPSWFTIEIANSNGSDNFIFYVSVPSVRRDLFEKQIISVFPHAHIVEHKDDYNIFNDAGVSYASYAKLARHPLYPLKSYREFDTDPLGAILNSFSKIDREGEGAAIQLVVGGRDDTMFKNCEKAIEKIREGKKVNDALAETVQSNLGAFGKEVLGIFKSAKAIEKEKEDDQKRAQTLDQNIIESFTKKMSSPFISVNIRIAASAATGDEASGILGDIESAFNQFESGNGNRITWNRIDGKNVGNVLRQFSLRTFDRSEAITFNIEEMTSCIHFPATTERHVAPQLKVSASGEAPAPLEVPTAGTLLGINDYRGKKTEIYIAPEDRMRHFYVIGQTGTGKTTLLKNMILQDIKAGAGVCFVDPHGSDVQDILANIPKERYEDVVYFDPASVERPMALNMLEYDPRFPEQKTFVVNEMFSIFQKLYGAVPESMGPIFEQYFRNATGLVIEDPESGSTLLDVSRVMSNKQFRDLKISRCKNPIIVQFWREIAEKAGGEAALANVVPYITSKFDVFLANEIMRPIIVQEKSSFNFREIMDQRKILLVNLSKGRLGDINSHLLGLILVGKLLMASLSRVDIVGSGAKMNDFFLYLDEFQNITTDSIAVILSEARKYRLSLNLAHQFIGQLDEKIRNAVFGNVGSMAIYRVGTEDAEFLEKQLAPTFMAKDIININNFNAYVKMLAGGKPIKPFNIQAMPFPAGNVSQVEDLKKLSMLKYGRDKAIIESEIMGKYNTGNK
ncbi:MAG: DUF87 domain-containing protein [Patescibacteria group bacterium]|nr:DUF87 domain-containing protein [Patescibacteria group bacterium]